MNEMRKAFFDINSTRLARCLAPGLSCRETAIRAHSIQNATHLGLLARDGHLIQLTRRFDPDDGPKIAFGTVGRRQASTFTGLCAAHDREFFDPIEQNPINLNDDWHLFLLAYRAILRETHATMEAGTKAQLAYLARVEAGIDPKNVPTPAGIFATERLMIAYDTYLFKERMDAAYLQSRPSAMAHDVFRMRVASPSVAASALFSLDGLESGDETVRVCLTVLPLTGTETGAVFSYSHGHEGLARMRLSRVLEATGAHQQYEISRLLLNSCENFVISPAAFDRWPPSKRESISGFFVRTLFQNDLSVEDDRLMLFELDN